MACEYCLGIGGHHNTQCPYYEPTKSKHNCSICKENIFVGDEYIVNNKGDYAHWECVDYAINLAEFLGYEIKEMEDETKDEKYY